MQTATKKRKWKLVLAVVLVLVAIGAFVGWYKFFREEPQPEWTTATPDMRFKYGSIGAEHDAGFPRVANNCAACHTASYRRRSDENPTFVPTGPNHTLNLEAFFRFLVDCAKDPRFNADNLMREIK